MMTLERGFAIKVARIIDKAARDAASAVEQFGSSANIDVALENMNKELRAVFVPHYRTTIRLFGERILRAFKSHGQFDTKAEDIFSAEVAEWIINTSADRVVMVEDTTKSQIRAAITDGFGAEMTGTQVAASIVEKTGGVIAKNRGITISRTETHMASSFGSQSAAESTGIPMKKVWIAAEDERTREDHTAADSRYHDNPVDLRDEFMVGGDSMLQPGMGSDPAQNINCRCVVGYETT
jgi:uncharacterized protein with gpF-like domain